MITNCKLSHMDMDVYHIHQYHLNINFMTAPRSQPIRTRRVDAQRLNGPPIPPDRQNLDYETEIEEGFDEIDLGAQSDDYTNPTTIENDNYNIESGIGTLPKRFLPKIIHSLDERKHIPRNGIKHLSEGDMWYPDIKQNVTAAQVHQASKNSITVAVDEDNNCCTSSDDGLRCRIHSFMEEINNELDIQGRQINKILDDIQQSQQVRKG